MLDLAFTMPQQEKKEFELMPDDVYEATVKDVEMITSHFKDKETGEDKQALNFTFEIAEEAFKGRLAWKEVYPGAYITKSGPSMLLRIINAIRKADMTSEEAKGISGESINALVGQRIRVALGHNTKDNGSSYNKITSFLPSKIDEPQSDPQAPLDSFPPTEEISMKDIKF